MFSLQALHFVGQLLFRPSRKGTWKWIMMSATSLLPWMPSARSGYTRQTTSSSQLSSAQSILATTSAPRVWAVNAVRISHTTTNILKVWGGQMFEHIPWPCSKWRVNDYSAEPYQNSRDVHFSLPPLPEWGNNIWLWLCTEPKYRLYFSFVLLNYQLARTGSPVWKNLLSWLLLPAH